MRRSVFCIAVLLHFIHSPLNAFELVYQAASDDVYALPHDVIIEPRQQLLYVADNGNDRIAVLDATTLELKGTFGEGLVQEPHDVVLDNKGRLLVADTGNSRIAVFEIDAAGGKLIDEIAGSIARPEGVAVHPNGRIYATGAASGNVVAYEGDTVVYELDGLAAPHDVVVGPDRTLWIADAGNDRVVNVSENLQILRVFEGDKYSFNGPRYLDFDMHGRLYVADKYNHQIKVIDTDGSVVLVVGGPHSTYGPGYFRHPEGISIHADQVWFADTYNDRITRYQIRE